MKKLFTLLFLLATCQLAFANAGIYETYLSTSLNGGGESFKGTGGGNPTFQGVNLGTISAKPASLVFKLRGINSFQDNSSVVNSANFYYRVYKVGSALPAFTAVPLTLQGTSGNDKFWNNNAPDIQLLADANMVPGAYNVEIYFDAVTNGTNAAALLKADNGGANFIATFTIATVTLASEVTLFSAEKATNSTVISWLTASEKDNASFQIERATNGRDFSKIGEMKGAGNSNAVNNYSFTDVSPLSGVNYYRLKAVDFSGAATFSKVVSVDFAGKGGNKTTVYPNPTRDVLRVEFTAADVSTTMVQVTDVVGRVLLSQNVSVAKGANFVPLSVASLPSGAYFVKINNDVTRFVKL